MHDNRPIGLFDSGIGGLTVLKSLMTRLPSESFIYLGDTARLPYGSKSPSTIDRYLQQNIQFLLKQDVKAIVVACNSASTVLIGNTREFGIPVYNVIEPGALLAAQISVGKRVGVLGTKATVAARAYVKSLHAIDSTMTVYQQPCPLLVPLVEEGWEDDPLTNLVIYRYLTPILGAGIDTLILGCTHYPALRAGIAKVAGPNVQLVDSSEAIALLIQEDIRTERLKPSAQASAVRYLATDVSPGFLEVASRLMQPHLVSALEAVDL